MIEEKRRPWDHDDNRALIAYWQAVGSINLIAVMLDRTPSSVQTQASRLGLPRRLEQRDNHRRRWSQDDDYQLEAALVDHRSVDGRIIVTKVAESVGRSVDAIVTKLAKKYGGMDALKDLFVVPLASPGAGDGVPKAMPGKEGMRKCLSCTNPFWSEGAHNRICGKCRKRHETDSDWDF
jgi:hypothetical protein